MLTAQVSSNRGAPGLAAYLWTRSRQRRICMTILFVILGLVVALAIGVAVMLRGDRRQRDRLEELGRH